MKHLRNYIITFALLTSCANINGNKEVRISQGYIRENNHNNEKKPKLLCKFKLSKDEITKYHNVIKKKKKEKLTKDKEIMVGGMNKNKYEISFDNQDLKEQIEILKDAGLKIEVSSDVLDYLLSQSKDIKKEQNKVSKYFSRLSYKIKNKLNKKNNKDNKDNTSNIDKIPSKSSITYSRKLLPATFFDFRKTYLLNFNDIKNETFTYELSDDNLSNKYKSDNSIIELDSNDFAKDNKQETILGHKIYDEFYKHTK